MRDERRELATRDEVDREAQLRSWPSEELGPIQELSLRNSKSLPLKLGACALLGSIPLGLVLFIETNPMVVVVSVVLGLTISTVGSLLLSRRDYVQQLAWVRSGPYGLDPDEYLRMLDQPFSPKAAMTATLHFHSEVYGFDQPTIASAVRERSGADEATFDDEGRLVVRSPAVKTRFPHDGNPNTGMYNSNRLLHRWFRALVESLAPIHQAHAIERITVSVAQRD